MGNAISVLRTFGRPGAVVGTVVVMAVHAPRAAAQQPVPAPRPQPAWCDSCDVDDSALDRQFEQAQRDLERARENLETQMDSFRTLGDSTGARAEAVARAEGELRLAEQRYDLLMSRTIQARLERAQYAAERAMRIQLRSRAPRGWLGVVLLGATSERGMGEQRAIRYAEYPTVESVDPGSPAERAGVQARDKLIALDGRDVTQTDVPLGKLLMPGARLTLRVKRGGEMKDLVAVIQPRPRSEMTFNWSVTPEPDQPEMPPAPAAPPMAPLPPTVVELAPMPRVEANPVRIEIVSPDVAIAGAQVRPVGSLADYFGVDRGVLVLRVVPGTIAARSGLRDGDVIVKADGRTVDSPAALSRAMYRAGGHELKLDVIRKKHHQSVVLRWDD